MKCAIELHEFREERQVWNRIRVEPTTGRVVPRRQGQHADNSRLVGFISDAHSRYGLDSLEIEIPFMPSGALRFEAYRGTQNQPRWRSSAYLEIALGTRGRRGSRHLSEFLQQRLEICSRPRFDFANVIWNGFSRCNKFTAGMGNGPCRTVNPSASLPPHGVHGRMPADLDRGQQLEAEAFVERNVAGVS